MQNLLRGRYHRVDAHPQHLHPSLVSRGRSRQAGTHLHGQQHKLHHQHQYQHQTVFVAGKEGIHRDWGPWGGS